MLATVPLAGFSFTDILESLRVTKVKRVITISFILMMAAASAYAQGKGVDPQSSTIRDSGNERAPANNGTKQDTGAGPGINFGKGRTPEAPPIPNPYRFTARRDSIMQAVTELIRDRGMILDEAASKPDEGILITQPYTFSKGAVVTSTELNRYTDLPPSTARGWTRGRYTLIIEVQPIDGVSANLSVTAKIEGRTDGATGAEWTTLRSIGVAEQEFLGALIEKVTGAPPPGSIP
jgi:hypothetical protein